MGGEGTVFERPRLRGRICRSPRTTTRALRKRVWICEVEDTCADGESFPYFILTRVLRSALPPLLPQRLVLSVCPQRRLEIRSPPPPRRTGSDSRWPCSSPCRTVRPLCLLFHLRAPSSSGPSRSLLGIGRRRRISSTTETSRSTTSTRSLGR